MRKIFHFVLLLVATVQFQTAESSQSQIVSWIDPLPPNLKPLNYNLNINIEFTHLTVPLSGIVAIKILCVEKTNTIILNIKDLNIISTQVIIPNENSKLLIPIKSLNYELWRDRYIITLDIELQVNQIYNVVIAYNKNSAMEFSDQGFFQYYYKRGPNEADKVIGFIYTEFNDARRLFPCFDQIYLKATFKLQISLNFHRKIGSKTRVITSFGEKTVTHSNTDGIVIFYFETDDPISTYSLAIAVMGNLSFPDSLDYFLYIPVIQPDKEFLDEKLFAEDITNSICRFFTNYLREYVTTNLFILALSIPNFREMKTEKFNLLMMKESTLLAPDTENDEIQIKIFWKLCYAISQQWFGARVTMSQWNEYWLHTALASVLQNHCLTEMKYESDFSKNDIPPEKISKFSDLQLVESFTRVLRNDGQSISHPVHVREDQFDFTKALEDSILSEKAYIIIRMMNYFLGNDVFQKGLIKYYAKFKFKNSNLDQVWDIFNEVKRESPWPENETVKTIMESWISKSGFSLVIVTRDGTNKEAILRQEHFIQLEDEDDKVDKTIQDNDYRIIPVSYVRGKELLESSENNFQVKLWLKEKAIIAPIENDEFLLVSLGLNVLCHVNYEDSDWIKICTMLRDKNQYKNIDKMSRVRLILDMFALARVGKFSYELLFTTMQYLTHEDSDLPLMVALDELNNIRLMLFNTDTLRYFKEYMKKILQPIFMRKRSTEMDQLQKLITEFSCNVGVEQCVEQCSLFFNSVYDRNSIDDIDTTPNAISKAIREIAYCQAMKNINLTKWKKLVGDLRLYNKEESDTNLVIALGCFIRGDNMKNSYLPMIFQDYNIQSKVRVDMFRSVAKNEYYYAKLKDYFIDHFEDLKKSCEDCRGMIGSLLSILFEATNTEEDFSELRKITMTHKTEVEDSENLLKQSMKIARKKSLWRKKIQSELRKWDRYLIRLSK